MPLFRKNHNQSSTFNSPLNGGPTFSEPHLASSSKGKFPIDKLVIYVIAIAVLLFIAFNAYSLLGGGSLSLPSFSSTGSQVKNLEITVVSVDDCEGVCFNLKTSVEELAQAVLAADSSHVANVSILSFDASSPQGQSIITRFSVTKLPVAIFNGDTSILPSVVSTQLTQVARNQSGFLVVEPTGAPYFSLGSSEIVGIVDAIAIYSAACTKCTTVDTIIGQLESAGVKFGKVEDIDLSSSKARELITKYNLTLLPALIFSSELEKYPHISAGWSTLGYVGLDGNYVLSRPMPPVLNLSTNKTEGLVSVTYIVDNSCTKCYNVSMHRSALEQSGLYLDNELTLDVETQQARSLIDRYNLTQVPTIILSPDASKYAILAVAWGQVGTFEKDGYLVFRNLTRVPGITYRNLQSGKIESNPVPTGGPSQG